MEGGLTSLCWSFGLVPNFQYIQHVSTFPISLSGVFSINEPVAYIKREVECVWERVRSRRKGRERERERERESERMWERVLLRIFDKHPKRKERKKNQYFQHIIIMTCHNSPSVASLVLP